MWSDEIILSIFCLLRRKARNVRYTSNMKMCNLTFAEKSEKYFRKRRRWRTKPGADYFSNTATSNWRRSDLGSWKLWLLQRNAYILMHIYIKCISNIYILLEKANFAVCQYICLKTKAEKVTSREFRLQTSYWFELWTLFYFFKSAVHGCKCTTTTIIT